MRGGGHSHGTAPLPVRGSPGSLQRDPASGAVLRPRDGPKSLPSLTALVNVPSTPACPETTASSRTVQPRG